MKRLFDPKDGWPVLTRRQFVGELLTAILLVFCLWAMTVGSIAYSGPTPS